MKVDETVKKETLYITKWVVILFLISQMFYVGLVLILSYFKADVSALYDWGIVLDKWDYKFPVASIISGLLAVLNFFFMGLTIQSTLEMDEKSAQSKIKMSQSLRKLILFGISAANAYLFNWIGAVLPLFFPRIAIAFRIKNPELK